MLVRLKGYGVLASNNRVHHNRLKIVGMEVPAVEDGVKEGGGGFRTESSEGYLQEVPTSKLHVPNDRTAGQRDP